METTRVFECPACHAEIIEPRRGPREAKARAGEFAAVVVDCPDCGTQTKFDIGAAQAGDSPASAVIPCAECGTVVEAYGTSQDFIDHVAKNPALHDLHRR